MLRVAIRLSVIFSNSWIAGLFAGIWEVPEKTKQDPPVYDYGIFLSRMFEYNTDLTRLGTRGGSDRLWPAIHLYHGGKIKKYSY